MSLRRYVGDGGCGWDECGKIEGDAKTTVYWLLLAKQMRMFYKVV